MSIFLLHHIVLSCCRFTLSQIRCLVVLITEEIQCPPLHWFRLQTCHVFFSPQTFVFLCISMHLYLCIFHLPRSAKEANFSTTSKRSPGNERDSQLFKFPSHEDIFLSYLAPPICAVYLLESSGHKQTHLANIQAQDENKSVLKLHAAHHHNNRGDVNFSMKVTGVHDSSLDRQVTERVNIENFKGPILMNRRTELGGVRIERMQYRKLGGQ